MNVLRPRCALVRIGMALATALPLAGTVRAASAPGLTLTDAWMRALPTLPAAGYFSLHNGSDHAVTLTSASATACGALTLHQTVRMRTMSHRSGLASGVPAGMPGMTSMHPVTQVGLAAGDTLHFMPGGFHLMCERPDASVAPGHSIMVTLHFAGGSSLTSAFEVRRPGAG